MAFGSDSGSIETPSSLLLLPLLLLPRTLLPLTRSPNFGITIAFTSILIDGFFVVVMFGSGRGGGCDDCVVVVDGGSFSTLFTPGVWGYTGGASSKDEAAPDGNCTRLGGPKRCRGVCIRSIDDVGLVLRIQSQSQRSLFFPPSAAT